MPRRKTTPEAEAVSDAKPAAKTRVSKARASKTRTGTRTGAGTATEAAAPSSARTLWKGAISFGLVHIPIGLYSATADSGIDFDWLDKRSMQPVGYKRVNKVTGREVPRDAIVRGVAVGDGEYVVMSAKEIEKAFPKTTRTIEIEAFVEVDEIPFVYLERPYYTAPLERGHKVYALLREALVKSGKVGVAKVVIQTRQHLAIVIPCGRALVLNLLRWGGEIRSFEALDLPPSGARANGIKDSELAMAGKLIDDLSQAWKPADFRNAFGDEIRRLVEAKSKQREVEQVEKPDDAEPAGAGAEVVDLSALLRRSLSSGRKPSRGGRKAA